MYNYIINPNTYKKVLVDSSKGHYILNNYINYVGGAGVSSQRRKDAQDLQINALWEWEEDELDDLKDVIKNINESILPPKIEIHLPDTLSGIYVYVGGGGGGAIYSCDDKPLIIKVLFSALSGDKEVRLQQKSKDLAPKIYKNIKLDKLDNKYTLLDDDMLEYWDGEKDVNTKILKLLVYNDEPIYIIIMDYLDPSAWIPLSKIKDINKDLLYTTVKSLVYKKGIHNPIDLVGYTGVHIFYNKKTNKFKIIDYGFFTDVKKTDNKDKLVETMWQSIISKFKI
jgi:hypothetical protein